MSPSLFLPGSSAGGHVADNGFWHPGSSEGCPKCEPAPAAAGILGLDLGRRPCTGGELGHCDIHDAPWALAEERCDGADS